MSYFITDRAGDYIEAILDEYTDLAVLGDGWQPGSKAHIPGIGDFTVNASGRWASEGTTLEQSAVVVLGSDLTYTGSELTKSVTSVKIGSTTLTANTDYEVKNNKATYAGHYVLDIVGKGTYAGVISRHFDVAAISATKPTKSANKTYSGSELTVTLTNFNASTMNVSGNKATEPGDYVAVVSLKDKNNYKWADGTVEDLHIAWSVVKATGTLSLSDSTKSVAKEATANVTITTNSNGRLTVISDDEDVATVSVSESTITITGVSAGTANVKVNVDATEHYTAPTEATCAVTVTE